MKKLLVTMLCMLSFFPAVAQNKVQWGMEVGAGMSAWMGKNADGSKPLFNPKVGVTLDIPLNWLVSFQTGLNWTSKGASYKKKYMPIRIISRCLFWLHSMLELHQSLIWCSL